MVRVTLKDVAARTGVTVSTVSSALNGTGRVSSPKKKLIKEVATQMGFQPNLAAKILKANFKNIFGLVFSDNIASVAGHGVFSELQEQFIADCNTDRLRAHIEINRELKLPMMLTDGMVGGVIHVGMIFDELKEWLKLHPTFPFVSFEEPWKHCVLSEFSKGVFHAVQYLAATGHKRIGLICGPEHFDMHKQTIEGFKKGINEFGYKPFDNMIQIQQKTDRGHEIESIGFLNKLIKSKDKPDALILSGKKLTSVAMYHLLSNGIKVPEDMSIVGICSTWEAASIYPGITAVERNSTGLTSEAIKMLLRISRGIDCAEKQIHVPTEFKIRNTVLSRLTT